ncbi:GNAT family N-acetyltransferase [Desulfovibrio sp. ZJ200]|uniref:TraB/GumN family protein n=1 Tax=Desulfovibrio sp. ZJ200 TaxID=2709792 RepID=UPI001F154064|nr:GNAT family N-acetyltransferase [Desulfovibrio sp. ZJ200]
MTAMPTDFVTIRATVPEHSTAFMAAMSGGTPFVEDGFLFFSGSDGSDRPDVAPWLTAVAYPLADELPAWAAPDTLGDTGPKAPLRQTMEAFEAALTKALRRTGARRCWLVGPVAPERLEPFVTERDEVYILDVNAPTPARLRNVLARSPLRVREGKEFTPAHRRLWTEFMGRAALRPNVRELYARTASVLNAPGTDLRLFDAVDAEGRVAASLLLDFAPPRFCTYLIGAHSRAHYAPHATDLLFRAMLEAARREGKAFIHLGVGVNEGIRRFKRKWGGRPVLPYVAAAWEERPAASPPPVAPGADVVRALLTAGPTDKWRFVLDQPEQRPFAMLWRVDKNGHTSWLGGTAHFFCCSFERSLRRLFEKVDTIILEGPLDQDSLAEVDEAGRVAPPPGESVLDHLTGADVILLERVLCRRRLLADGPPPAPDVLRELLGRTRPWYAFFSLWTLFLEQRGWKQSVDLEIWNLAGDMGKTVFGMETVAEQIAALEAAPMERIVRFLRDCRRWDAYRRRNAASYLAGNLEGMLGTSTEFPSRTEHIIDHRDQRFRERMRPWLERGGAAVFVGSAHLLNLRRMLTEDGFTLRRVLPTWRHRLSALWNKETL